MDTLVVKKETSIADYQNKDFLDLYNISEPFTKYTSQIRSDLIQNILTTAAETNALTNLLNCNSYTIEISEGLQQMLKEGKAYFGKSSKVPGNFTPNIHIVGEGGVKQQITISKGNDFSKITNGISQLAMIGLVQSMSSELADINEKLDLILTNIENDRIGRIIGPFKGFIDGTYKTEEERRIAANTANIEIQTGLTQLLEQIDTERKLLETAPNNEKQFVWSTIKWFFKKPFKNMTIEYQNNLSKLTYHINLYSKLILLSDLVIFQKDNELETIKTNHQPFHKFCTQYLDKEFTDKMKFINNGEITSFEIAKNEPVKIMSKLDKAKVCDCMKIEC